MIVIKLREAMLSFKEKTGKKMTYAQLAEATGLSKATLESISARANYNPRLSTIDSICKALDCTPHELLEYAKGNNHAD